LAADEGEAVVDEAADYAEDKESVDELKLDYPLAGAVFIIVTLILMVNLVGVASTLAPLSRVTLTVIVISAVTIDLQLSE